ncbi:hypothetical protein [Roseivivax sp. CAU 1753]
MTTGKTSAEIELEKEVQDLDQVTRTIIASNTVQGGLAGALGGCVISGLTNGDCGSGALRGGMLGGIRGNQVGQQAAQVKRDLVQADQTIANLKEINRKLSGVEANLRMVIDRQDSEIASLKRQLGAGQVSAQSVNARVSAINDNRTAVIDGLLASERNVSEERARLVAVETQSGQSLSQAKNAVGSTQNRIASMRKSIAMASI